MLKYLHHADSQPMYALVEASNVNEILPHKCPDLAFLCAGKK